WTTPAGHPRAGTCRRRRPAGCPSGWSTRPRAIRP
ncbi:MAG: hypothetical protein AVDCRST_MAG57-169, partial [uncultured Blastococcus sp.]